MRRYLLPREGHFYKANLHCHSTDSDGRFTPEELCAAYKEHGYSVLAITDHNLMKDRRELCRDDFLVLHGYEYNHEPMSVKGRCVHLGLIAKDPENFPELISDAFSGPACAETDAEFTDHINDIIKRATDDGFLPIYNHMRWSHECEADLLGYEGFFAMELFNYFSEVLGIEEYNLSAYLTKLRQGARIFGVMTDDNHNMSSVPVWGLGEMNPWNMSFGGYIQIKAKELTYKSIIEAMERGDFYASSGPEIRELYIEDGTLHIECSEAKSISVNAMTRRGFIHWHPDGAFTEADFKLRGNEEFIVVIVTDKYGKRAVSQPYFI